MTETSHDRGPVCSMSVSSSPVDRRAILCGLGGVGALAASLGVARIAVARQDAGSQVPRSMEPHRTRAKRQ